MIDMNAVINQLGVRNQLKKIYGLLGRTDGDDLGALIKLAMYPTDTVFCKVLQLGKVDAGFVTRYYNEKWELSIVGDEVRITDSEKDLTYQYGEKKNLQVKFAFLEYFRKMCKRQG